MIQDMRWRGKLRKFLPKRSGLKLLGLATGTGDQILALAYESPEEDNAAVGDEFFVKNFPKSNRMSIAQVG